MPMCGRDATATRGRTVLPSRHAAQRTADAYDFLMITASGANCRPRRIYDDQRTAQPRASAIAARTVARDNAKSSAGATSFSR
jgi:hypothetical protein